MKLESVTAITEALNTAHVRYLVVGGLAVVAHGHLRFTKDLDLVIQLQPENLKRAMGALHALGYKPLLPVTIEQFADQATRESWVRDRNMVVFQLWSDQHRQTPIDVFVSEPFDFNREYEISLCKTVKKDLLVRVISIPTLIAMKEAADRPQDRADVASLRERLMDVDRE